MAGLAVLAWCLAGCASAASSTEVKRIAAALGLQPGMSVADVGAGDGEFAVELAHLVGANGRVIATEVEEGKVRDLREMAEDESLSNLTAVLGDQEGTGLDAGCCDAVLLRLVYHHFQAPATMRADLRAALRPDGRIVVIDIVPQESWPVLPDVPERGGHGIPPAQLLEEMTGDGFELVARFDEWNGDAERFCMVFLRRQVDGDRPPE
jgi:SAM-dependent methyltransferase